MKKNFYIIFLILMIFTFKTSNAEEKTSFATKGIIELGGSIDAYKRTYQNNDSTYELEFDPEMNYYIYNNVHIGFVPSIIYEYNYSKDLSDSKLIYFGPQVLIGYTFKFAETLFFDLSPFYRYTIGKWYINNNNYKDVKSRQIFYGINLSLKYVVGNVLINTTLSHGYFKYHDNNNYKIENIVITSLRVGISTYF